MNEAQKNDNSRGSADGPGQAKPKSVGMVFLHAGIDLVQAAREFKAMLEDLRLDTEVMHKAYVEDMTKIGHAPDELEQAWTQMMKEEPVESQSTPDQVQAPAAVATPSALARGSPPTKATQCVNLARKITAHRPHLIPCIIAASMAFVAIADLPYDYYTLMRLVVCPTGVLVVVVAAKSGQAWAAWVYSILAMLFNPIVPVHLTKGLWQPLDFIAGALLVTAAFVVPAWSAKTVTESGGKTRAHLARIWAEAQRGFAVAEGGAGREGGAVHTAVPVDPADFAGHIKVGVYYAEHGQSDFAGWSTEMVKHMGDSIRPYLEGIWSEVQKQVKPAEGVTGK